MRTTSDLYKKILEDPNHKAETRLAIGKKVASLDSLKTFIYDSEMFSMSTSKKAFSKEDSGAFCIGGCLVGTIDAEMKLPVVNIPRQAKIVPQVRICDQSGNVSEWLDKGVFFIDTREILGKGKNQRLVLTGYDAMLKTEQDYPKSKLDWPAWDFDVVKEIADYIGVGIDQRTVDTLRGIVQVQYPAEYTCRETLGFIAAAYGGCFVMNDVGELRLITLRDLRASQGVLLATPQARPIMIGGEAILV